MLQSFGADRFGANYGPVVSGYFSDVLRNLFRRVPSFNVKISIGVRVV
jgi:hypothetical protein